LIRDLIEKFHYKIVKFIAKN